MKLLNQKPKSLLEDFLQDYSTLFKIDSEKVRTSLKDKTVFNILTEKWYDLMQRNMINEAMGIYDDDYYFVDIFDCYQRYSRKYLRNILKSEIIRNVDSFVDIGCGLGYSTAALKEIFPSARAYATNLPNTKQWKFCELMASRYDFKLCQSTSEIGHPVSLVFASEYFEHIFNPIEHLQVIISDISPSYFVIANSFNTKSIGHFEYYHHNQSLVHESKISRMFNEAMRDLGYEKLKTGFWNNRPVVWKRG